MKGETPLPVKTIFLKIIETAGGIAADFFPYKCAGCGVECRDPVCAACQKRIRRISEPFCKVCGRALPVGVFETEGCSDCGGEGSHYDLCRSALAYDEPVNGLVKNFKFKRNIHCGKYLCGIMTSHINENQAFYECCYGADCIAPVPLYPVRRITRGFNQSDMIAVNLSRITGAPVKNILQRVRNTKQQSLLPKDQRTKNVKNAFRVRGGGAEGKKIVLVDDVVTTGATIIECSKTLKEAGAKEVVVFSLARRC